MGTGLQQGSGVLAAGPDICAQTEPTLPGDASIDVDGIGIRVRHYRLPVGTAAIEPCFVSRVILR